MKKKLILLFLLILFFISILSLFVKVGRTYEIKDSNTGNIILDITCYKQDLVYEKDELDFCLSIRNQKDDEKRFTVIDVNLFDSKGDPIVPSNILSSDLNRKFFNGKENLILEKNFPVIVNFQRIRLPKSFDLDIRIENKEDGVLHIKKSVHRKYYLYLNLITV